MRALGFGMLAALVLAGPTLNGQVQEGSMSGTTALLRGGLLAVGCAVGFSVIMSIIGAYRAQQDEAAELARVEAATARLAEAEAEALAEVRADAARERARHNEG